MGKSQLFKYLVLIGISFILYIKKCSAFFSPSTFQLLTASIGPWIQYILVLIITSIITFAIKTKKNWKKYLKVILLISLAIMIVIICINYFVLLNKNTNNNPALLDELAGLSIHEMMAIDKERDINFDEKILKEKYTSLNNLSKEEYNNYKKIVLWDLGEEYPIKNTTYINIHKLWELLNNDHDKLEKHLNYHNITKDDKILFICHTGWSSQIASYYLDKIGYKTFHTRINDINNTKFIDSNRIKEINNARSIIVKPLTYLSKENYFLFLFNIEERNLLDHCPELFNDDILYDNIYGIISVNNSEIDMLEFYPDMKIFNINEIKLTNLKIMCISQFHCLLTKHLIDSLKIDTKTVHLPRCKYY